MASYPSLKDATVQTTNATLTSINNNIQTILANAGGGSTGASLSIANSLWVDATGGSPVFYVRREVDNAGTITITWETPSGAIATPTIANLSLAYLSPLASTAANQVAANNSLSSINTKLPTTLNGDGGLLAHITNLPTTQAVTETYANIATSQVTVGSTATLICAQRTGRASITIVMEGTTDVRLGTIAVTTSTGVLLAGTKGAAFTIDGGAAIYGITTSGTQLVSYVETF